MHRSEVPLGLGHILDWLMLYILPSSHPTPPPGHRGVLSTAKGR